MTLGPWGAVAVRDDSAAPRDRKAHNHLIAQAAAGQKWKEVRHDKTVTWLAMWNDPVNTKQFKYVWLAPTSSWKADSDLQK